MNIYESKECSIADEECQSLRLYSDRKRAGGLMKRVTKEKLELNTPIQLLLLLFSLVFFFFAKVIFLRAPLY